MTRPGHASHTEGLTRGGRIRVEGIRFGARVGVEPQEHEGPTAIAVDVTAWRDLEVAADSDDIRDTLDYRGLCTAVVEIGTGRSYHLIETMASCIAEGLGTLAPGVAFEVTVWKVRPPLSGHPERVGVTVIRPGPVWNHIGSAADSRDSQ